MSLPVEEEAELPERAPSWMLFFEGTLYRRYLNYLNQHDFSQILNNKISLDESFYGGKSFYTDFPPENDVSDFPPNDLQDKTKDLEPPEVLRMTSTTSDKFLTESDRRRRLRRTRAFICFGIFCIAAFAAAASLVIHFVFIKGDKGPVKDPIIRIGNGTLNGTDVAGNQSDITTNITLPKSTDFVSTLLSDHATDEVGSMEKELKLLESVNKPDNIVMSSNQFYIGDKDVVFSCTLTNLKNWNSVYIIGDKVRDNSSALNFNVTSDLKSTVKGKRDKIRAVSKARGQNEIQLMLMYKTVECDDRETYTCGIDNEDGTSTTNAKLLVAKRPKPSVSMIVPVEVVSGKLLRISASWSAGYPQPWGNISWTHTKGEDSNAVVFENTKHFWTLKKDDTKCETIVGSFINFTPTMKDNNTQVIATAILNSERKAPSTDGETAVDIKQASNTILVVPEDHCHGINNDTNIAHPYTCSKFVRCLADKMVVFPCPGDTCFTKENGQCDYITSTSDKVAIS